ncbi:hypothetical protein Plec18167_001639 [Paecilomyces lecythidis]|uniref:Uncharacterized protein n=1 Tax=Paecilomyces lecythidis TaxID=3004212 RepID=A0ABR3YB13_9EURO
MAHLASGPSPAPRRPSTTTQRALSPFLTERRSCSWSGSFAVRSPASSPPTSSSDVSSPRSDRRSSRTEGGRGRKSLRRRLLFRPLWTKGLVDAVEVSREKQQQQQQQKKRLSQQPAFLDGSRRGTFQNRTKQNKPVQPDSQTARQTDRYCAARRARASVSSQSRSQTPLQDALGLSVTHYHRYAASISTPQICAGGSVGGLRLTRISALV